MFLLFARLCISIQIYITQIRCPQEWNLHIYIKLHLKLQKVYPLYYQIIGNKGLEKI